MKSRSSAPGLVVRGTLLALACAASARCQQPLLPVFPEPSPPIVWPRPPDAARIRYIGELTGESSLNRPRSGWQNLGELLTGPSPSVKFVTPTGVAVRGDVVYVTDSDARAVYRLDLTKRTLTAIHSADGEAFGRPIDVAVSDSRLAVCDSARASVFLFDMNGNHLATLSGGLKRPSSVAWSAAEREWWVLDAGAHACFVFGETGSPLRSLGTRGAGEGEFNFPAGLAVTSNHGTVIADSMNFRVQTLGTTTRPARSFGKKGDAAGDFALPRDVAFDSDGNIYVLDNQFENVQIFDGEGRLLMAFGEEGKAIGQFHLPAGIAVDEQDRIWIADTYNRRVQVFQYLAEKPQ